MDELPLFSDEGHEPAGPRQYTVSEISRYIRQRFEADAVLQDVWIEGEISNYKRAASGHLYFTLKDDQAQLRCAMWRSQAGRLRFEPKDGDHVQGHGQISVYEQRGEYQLYVDTLQPVGLGDLHAQFEMLKAKLEGEGLFDAERKRPVPLFPVRIGVVTSPTTAAFQDVLNVLRRRFPLAEVLLSPTLVQGNEAAPQIIGALNHLNQRDDIDVILLIRGGGSLEDLWCFNDEQLARVVADSRLPLVTGVGHEIDFTLVDFASDLRAPTPSAAAELVVPNIIELAQNLKAARQRGENAMVSILGEMRQDLAIQQRTLRHLSPAGDIRNARQRVDDVTLRLARGIRGRLVALHQELATQQASLRGSSPRAILARGYAIVTRAGDGKQISDAIDAAEGTMLDIRLHRGELKANVRERELED
jgi:exodeoxyribonuclease VII large subunit